MRKTKKKKNILLNFIVLFSAIILMLLFFELFFRIALSNYSITWGGVGLNKLLSSTEFNNIGFRGDKNISLEKNGKIRIAILGDSMSFGHGINNNSNIWPSKLEHYLNKYSEKNIEVINSAWPGTHTGTQTEIYKYLLRKYQPDIVIVGYFLNDARPNKAYEDEIKYYDKFKSKNYLNGIYDVFFGKFLLENSYLYNFIVMQKDRFKQKNFHTSYIKTINSTYTNRSNLKYHTEELNQLFVEIREDQSTPLLVIIPYFYNFEDYPFDSAHSYLRDIAEENNVDYIDLIETFKNKDTADYIIGKQDTHINEKGSDLIAREITKELISKNIVKSIN